MPSSLQALLALLLLLPGFLTARIVRMLNARSQQSDLERIIQALIYSFLIYAIYLGVFGASLPIDWLSADSKSALSQPHIVIHRERILTLVGTAIALGVSWGLIKGQDFHMKLLRACRITERTSRESVWNDVLLTQSGTVQVSLADGRMVLGILDRYSDTGEEGSLFLSEASWVSEDGELVPIIGAGVLLTKSADIKFIMFLDPPSIEASESEA